MFWRIFATYLLLVTLAVGLVGLMLLQRADGSDLIVELSGSVALQILFVSALAAIPAYLFAHTFTAPLNKLMDGAQHLSDGDLGYQILVSGGQEFTALARTFNIMSDRLAATFAQLRHDREQLRTILSGMVEGVVAFDNDQRVLFVNDRAAELLGFTVDTAVERKLWEVTRQRALGEMVMEVLAGSGPRRQELDWNGVGARSLAIYVSRLPGPDSHGAVMVIQDTSELRRLERLRQDFVANVSHELKTPLANIKSSVEVLLDGAVEDSHLRGGFLSEISNQADRLDALIQDLLTLARIESGATGLELESVSVEDAVHACLDRHRTRAEVKGLTLSAVALGTCPPDLSVFVDEEGLAQILDNLVDNAIKYTPASGRITVRWQARPPGLVTLEIEDTGIGIPDRDLPCVFERFYRVDKARSREMGGTGLGLAIVKHLIQAMRGSINVTSKVGSGTLFRLTLPRSGSDS